MMRSEALRLDLGDAPDGLRRERLGPGAVVLRDLASPRAPALVAAIGELAAVSPFRHMVTPGGWTMSVALTNCGAAGWVTDRSGYRYDAIDPPRPRGLSAPRPR